MARVTEHVFGCYFKNQMQLHRDVVCVGNGGTCKDIPVLIDIRDMPGYNPKSNTTNQEERDVSSGQVFWTENNRVTCRDHGAMLCVSARRDLWRCTGALGCHAGAYVDWPKC